MLDAEKSIFTEKLEQYLDTGSVNYWLSRTNKIAMIDKYQSKLNRIGRVYSKEDLNDYLAEIRYALLFLSLQYKVIMEPCGDKGPDLKIIKDEFSALIEVTRFRPSKICQETYNMLGKQPEELKVNEYASVNECIQRIYTKVIGKFEQIDGYRSIIAIWNDSEEIDYADVKPAIKDMMSVNDGSIDIPANLELIIFSSFESSDKQVYSYRLKLESDEKLLALLSDLEGFRLDQI
jgi:hypothetical protein